jgi:hypothetical protein
VRIFLAIPLLSRIQFKDSSIKIGNVLWPDMATFPVRGGLPRVRDHKLDGISFIAIQRCPRSSIGVVAGDLVIGIAEQTGAANRVHANIVAADHGVHWDLEWGAAAGQRMTVI